MVRTIERFEALLRRTCEELELPLAAVGCSSIVPPDALLASARVTDAVRVEIRCARALAVRLGASVFHDLGPATAEDLDTMLVHLADALAGCVDRADLEAVLASPATNRGEIVRRCFSSEADLLVVALVANGPLRAEPPRLTG